MKCMTVNELIEALKPYAGDMPVVLLIQDVELGEGKPISVPSGLVDPEITIKHGRQTPDGDKDCLRISVQENEY